jgi:hypothetical protein
MSGGTNPCRFVNYLILKKASETLDIPVERTIDILEGYGAERNLRRIISTVWSQALDTMEPKQAFFTGSHLDLEPNEEFG